MSKPLAALPLLVLTACQPGSTEPPAVASSGVSLPAPPGAVYDGDAFTFHQIRNDIYHAVGTGNLAVGCNGTVVINDEDVLLVDSHMTPAAAWALLRELKRITDKPVRYVVNTHFHFDHVHGNQVFPDDVEIIGHTYTRDKIASGGSRSGRSWDLFVGQLPQRIEDLERQRQTALDGTDDEKLADLDRQLAIQKAYYEATQAIEPTPPTVTLTDRMTLYRGGREIQLLYLGRAHTAGDVVVYLPAERVVATGDMLTAGIAYMGDGYLQDWVGTLENLKKLDFEYVLPGHGEAFTDRSKIDHFQALLTDLRAKIEEKHRAGVSAAEAAETIDMTNHAEHFPSITAPGVNPHAVERAYALLEGTER